MSQKGVTKTDKVFVTKPIEKIGLKSKNAIVKSSKKPFLES